MRNAVMALFLLLLVPFFAYADGVSWNLTEDGRYVIQVEKVNGEYVAFLKNSLNTWSRTDPNFIKVLISGLKIQVDGKPVKITVGNGAPRSIAAPAAERAVRISLYNNELAQIKAGPTGVSHRSSRNLSSYDVRKFSSDVDYPRSFRPVSSPSAAARPLTTDLHTHLAGHLEFQSLMKIARERNLEYPTELLDRLKVKYPQSAVVNGKIPMLSLMGSKEFKASNGTAALEDAMTIEKSRVRTFSDMEDKYLYRGPITKNPNVFKEMLWEAARSSKKGGTKYTEQSISNILDPEWLKVANAEVPKIEKELGVKMRFVAGLWRHSDPEWNLDELSRLKKIAQASPYVVGVDFMGHETNKTIELESQIKAAAALRKDLGPEFQVRVHQARIHCIPQTFVKPRSLAHRESVMGSISRKMQPH